MKGIWANERDPAHGLKGQRGVPELNRNMNCAETNSLGYEWSLGHQIESRMGLMLDPRGSVHLSSLT